MTTATPDTLEIFALDRSVTDMFYVPVDGKPYPVYPEETMERLILRDGPSGRVYADQYVDTPVGTFDLSEVLYLEHGTVLKKVPLLFVTNRSLLRLVREGRDVLERNVSMRPDGTYSTSLTYCLANRLGVVERTDRLWTDEVFTRCSADDVPAVWECVNPSETDAFNDEREAGFHLDPVGKGSVASRFSIGPEAEKEIRAAVESLRSALERNGVRMVLDEPDGNTVKFIRNVNVPGWEVDTAEGGDTDEWYEIPRSMYRDLGMGGLDVRYVGFAEYFRRKDHTDNKDVHK